MDPLRIGFLTVAPSPHLAGTLRALAEGAGISLEVRCLMRSLPSREWDAATVGVRWDLLSEGGGIAGLVDRCDLVVAASSYFHRATWGVVERAVRTGTPVVVLWEAPSTVSSPVVRQLRRWIVPRLLAKVDGLVGVTESTVKVYRSAFRFAGPASWCPYHRDLSPFLDRSPTPPGDTLRFLALASLVPLKGLDVAVKAVGKGGSAVRLTIAGEGPERRSLEATARRVAPGQVEFVGRIPFLETPAYLSKGHALVCPSRYDGFGMVVMEALASGLPVLASAGAHSALQYVREGENGWVTPAGDVSSLAQRMAELRDRRREWPALSVAARASLREYDQQCDAERLSAFLRDVWKRGRD